MSNELKTREQIASYGVGLQMGQQLRDMFQGSSLEAAITGMNDGFDNKPPVLTPDDINGALKSIQEEIQSKRAENAKNLAKLGEEFLAENAKKEGVVTTESGLQYKVLESGDGEKPTATSTVRTHYRGTLIDGAEFDSSYKRGEPAEFPVNGVIAGWTEALQLMPVGSKWELYIPYQLAYGEQGAGGAIGPYQALIFEIELLEII